MAFSEHRSCAMRARICQETLTDRRLHFLRLVKAIHVLLAERTVLLDPVKGAGEEVHAEHCDEEQPTNLEGRGS